MQHENRMLGTSCVGPIRDALVTCITCSCVRRGSHRLDSCFISPRVLLFHSNTLQLTALHKY